jgi:TctA family transporter
MQKMMYLLVSQHVSGIIMPIIRRMAQNRQRLWYTALAVLYNTGVVGFILFS